MTQFAIDNTKFYKIVPSKDGLQLEQQQVQISNVQNQFRENFIQHDNHYYLTSNLTEKFLDANKYRSEYDRMTMEMYHYK